MGGGLESRCVGRVYGAGTIRMRMRPKHVELRIHQENYLVASSWRLTLFHEQDARSNNPQIYSWRTFTVFLLHVSEFNTPSSGELCPLCLGCNERNISKQLTPNKHG